MWSKEICAGLIAASCLGFMSSSFANDSPVRQLKGVYRGTANINCLESQGGFTPGLQYQLTGYANRYTDSSMNTLVFHGDGTMTEKVQGTTYFQGDPYMTGGLGAGTFVGTCEHAVTMKPNKGFTLKGNCSGFLPFGPAAGLDSIVEDVDSQGQISEDGSIIVIGGTEPDANTLKLSNGYVAQRLCGGSATYVRLR